MPIFVHYFICKWTSEKLISLYLVFLAFNEYLEIKEYLETMEWSDEYRSKILRVVQLTPLSKFNRTNIHTLSQILSKIIRTYPNETTCSSRTTSNAETLLSRVARYLHRNVHHLSANEVVYFAAPYDWCPHVGGATLDKPDQMVGSCGLSFHWHSGPGKFEILQPGNPHWVPLCYRRALSMRLLFDHSFWLQTAAREY